MPPFNAPQGVDMDAIREALQRRAQGGLGGGTGMPAIQQQTSPTAALPTGGAGTPNPNPATPLPTPQPNQVPGQARQMPASSASPPQAAARQVGAATGFPDPETRDMAKTLLAKLVQFL